MAGRAAAKRRSDAGLVLIGVFKLLKGLSVLIVAIGLLRLVHKDVAATVTTWVERLRLDPDNAHIHALLSRVFRVTPKQLRELSAGSFLYAGLFLTEGINLLRGKRWAEWLTVVSTALFIPIEVFEIYRRFTWPRVGILGLNVITVWYLVRRIRRG
jgi:uncharacterized membrane protein (DUF2068 family)